MESICRLCCSTKFVNNHLFDEENALYLKMELYLPIKVRKLDRLPQKVCDRCSCKVNDLYQFCNEAMEAQHRLHDMLRHVDATINNTIDLTFGKLESRMPVPSDKTSQKTTQCDQSTQTETLSNNSSPVELEVKVKVEPKLFTPSPVKTEDNNLIESDHFDAAEQINSDNSEDNISLVSLKKKKKGRKPSTNGEVPKRGRKKKAKIADWESIINSLPENTAVKMADKPDGSISLDSMKEEMDYEYREGGDVHVKKEPADMDTLQCCICFTQCFSRADMLTHYKQHLSAAEAWAEPPAAPPPPDQHPLRCLRCRKVVEPAQWADHWMRHWERDSRPFRCALCEKTFRTASQILKHGLTHKLGEGGASVQEANKRFICDLCPEGFVYMRYLLAHRARAHPEAAARALSLRCAVCARAFAHLNSLRRHLRAHSGERNYLCNVCGKALTSREHLKFHIRIHTGYKPNVCKTCGKGFVKKCNLTLHERVHSGEKPHVCSHCGKAFSQRSTLVIHERYHSGARPYVCALCGRGFVAKGLLSMHLKTTCI